MDVLIDKSNLSTSKLVRDAVSVNFH